MSTPKQRLEETVRVQIHIIHEPDYLAGAVIERILAAAEEYARSCVEAATKGTLFEAPPPPGPIMTAADVVESKAALIKIIQIIREPLLAALPQGRQG